MKAHPHAHTCAFTQTGTHSWTQTQTHIQTRSNTTHTHTHTGIQTHTRATHTLIYLNNTQITLNKEFYGLIREEDSFGCWIPSKRNVLVHKNSFASFQQFVTVLSHALWRFLSNQVIWVLGHCWVDTSHIHTCVRALTLHESRKSKIPKICD